MEALTKQIGLSIWNSFVLFFVSALTSDAICEIECQEPSASSWKLFLVKRRINLGNHFLVTVCKQFD